MTAFPVPSGVLLARDAWRLGLGTIRAMPVLFGGTFALMLAFELAFCLAHPAIPVQAGSGVGPSGTGASSFGTLLDVANDLATDVIGASAFAAVHRALLLGETADRPFWRLPPGYDRYLAWLVLLGLPFLPFVALDAMAQQGPSAPAAVASVLALAAGAVVVLRLVPMLPLLAIEAPTAKPEAVWDATRGRFGRLLAAVLLTFVPMEAGAALVSRLFRGADGPEVTVLAAVLAALGISAKALLWGAVGAALFSRLLQTYGAGLARRPVWR